MIATVPLTEKSEDASRDMLIDVWDKKLGLESNI